MRGESFQNTMAVILVAILAAFVALLVNFTTWWPLYVPVLAAVAFAAYVFLFEADFAAPRVPPQEALRTLAQRLEPTGVRAALSSAGLTVRIDALAAVRLRTRTTDQGTVVSYGARATPLGAALAVLLIALIVTALPAVGLLVFLRVRARSFARTRVAGLLPAPSPPPPSRDEIHILLVGGLSTGERLARQAAEAQRSAYWDVLLDVLLAGFLAWIALLIGLFVAVNGLNLLTGNWTVPLVGATGVAGALVVVLTRLVRTRYRPSLSRYAGWADRLGLALARELSSRGPEPSEPSSFELLASATEQVPDWIEAQRRAGMSSDPAAGFVLLFLSSLALSLAFNAVPALARGELAVGAVFGLASVALGLGAAGYGRHWSRLQRERLARLHSDWDARTRALRERLDRFLQEM